MNMVRKRRMGMRRLVFFGLVVVATLPRERLLGSFWTTHFQDFMFTETSSSLILLRDNIAPIMLMKVAPEAIRSAPLPSQYIIQPLCAYTGGYVAADPDILLDSSAVTTTNSAPNETSIDQANRGSEGVPSQCSPNMGLEPLAESTAAPPDEV